MSRVTVCILNDCCSYFLGSVFGLKAGLTPGSFLCSIGRREVHAVLASDQKVFLTLEVTPSLFVQGRLPSMGKHAWQFCQLPAHGCPPSSHLHTGRMDVGYPAHLEGFRCGPLPHSAFSLQLAALCFWKAGATRCSISCRSGRETVSP